MVTPTTRCACPSATKTSLIDGASETILLKSFFSDDDGAFMFFVTEKAMAPRRLNPKRIIMPKCLELMGQISTESQEDKFDTSLSVPTHYSLLDGSLRARLLSSHGEI